MGEKASTAPRIGVTWVVDDEKTERYLRAVRDAGGEPVPLPAGALSWREELATLRGLLLTGGGDVDPARYGETNNEGLSNRIDADRDQMELDALRLSLERGLPVLGICRGHQVINVGMGGSLVQDVPSRVDRCLEHPSVDDVSRYHSVKVLPGTALASIAGRAGPVQVNSRHHQGVTEATLAPGMRASALASDGVVEGLEATDGRFIVGVQCHPERPGEAPEMAAVFRALVERARRT